MEKRRRIKHGGKEPDLKRICNVDILISIEFILKRNQVLCNTDQRRFM